MKRFLAICGATAVIAAAAIPASAQNALNEGQFSARIGLFLPFESALRNPADIWFAAGGDYELNRGLFPNAATVFSVDWYSQNGGARGNVFPLIISQRFYSQGVERRTYFQVGLGAAIIDQNNSDTVFALRGGVGMDFNDRFFWEANFLWTGDPSGGTSATGAAGFLGVRF